MGPDRKAETMLGAQKGRKRLSCGPRLEGRDYPGGPEKKAETMLVVQKGRPRLSWWPRGQRPEVYDTGVKGTQWWHGCVSCFVLLLLNQ